MPIWKLHPINLRHPDWNASAYRGDVIVRAPDERKARWAAARAFTVATTIIPDQDIPPGPWLRLIRVACSELSHSEWNEQGPIEILSPPHCNDDLKGVN